MIIQIVYEIIFISITFRIWYFIFTYYNINIFSIHDIPFGTFIASKDLFWAFPTFPDVLPTMLPNDPWFEKNIKYKIFSTLMPTMSLMYLLVSFNISNAVNHQHLGTLYCPKIKIKISYPTQWANAPSVSNIAFQQPYYCCYFVIPCQHFHLFVVPHLSSSLVLSMCIFVVDQP